MNGLKQVVCIGYLTIYSIQLILFNYDILYHFYCGVHVLLRLFIENSLHPEFSSLQLLVTAYVDPCLVTAF